MVYHRFFHSLFTLAAAAMLLAGCQARQPAVESSIPVPTATSWTAWQETEQAISEALLGRSDGKCEWQMLGWMAQERYIWAVCTEGPGTNSRGASGAAVVKIEPSGSIVSIEQPEFGQAYSSSILHLFPPAVREKVLNPDFDMFGYVSRLEQRWKSPALPPAIYEQNRETLPTSGEEAVPAISADTVDRVTQLAVLGHGNVHQTFFLPDGRVFASGDRGMRVFDPQAQSETDIFADLLQGSAGFLSSDGKFLAVVSDATITLYNTDDQTIKASIDTSSVPGKILKVTFLPDGQTIVFEKYIPGETSENRMAMYNIVHGEYTAVWSPTGWDYVLSPNGLYAVTGFGTVETQIWYLPDGRLWKSLPVFASAAAFSGDGQILALVELGKVKVYWVWDGFELGRLETNIGPIDGVALSPDGKLLLTWSRENSSARLWSVPDFKLIDVFDNVKGVSAAAFNADGLKLVLAADTFFAIYHLQTEEFGQFGFESYNAVWDISFSPDPSAGAGQRMVVLYHPGNSRSVLVNWDLATRRPVFEYPAAGIFQMEYLPEPYGIALGGEKGLIRLISAEDGNFIREMRTGESYSVSSMVSSPDDSARLAAGFMNVVRIFTLTDLKDNQGQPLRVSGGWVNQLAWNRCFLATGVGGVVSITDEPVQKFVQEGNTPNHETIQGLAILPDCSEVLAAGSHTVFRWQAETGTSLKPWLLPDQITQIAVSPDGSLLAVSLFDKTVRLLDTETGEELAALTEHRNAVTAVQFSPDGSLLATGGQDGVVILWGVGK